MSTTGQEIVLYSFGGTPDGANPGNGMTNVGGTLYGLTERGGANNLGTFFSFVF